MQARRGQGRVGCRELPLEAGCSHRLCVRHRPSALAALSAGVMVARRSVLGPEVRLPHGPDTWKVTMLVQGKSSGDAHLVTAVPLEGPRQHVVSEEWAGEEFAGAPPGRSGEPATGGHFGGTSGPAPRQGRSACDMIATAPYKPPPAHPGEPPDGQAHPHPKPGEYLRTEPGIETDDPLIADRAPIAH